MHFNEIANQVKLLIALRHAGGVSQCMYCMVCWCDDMSEGSMFHVMIKESMNYILKINVFHTAC